MNHKIYTPYFTIWGAELLLVGQGSLKIINAISAGCIKKNFTTLTTPTILFVVLKENSPRVSLTWYASTLQALVAAKMASFIVPQ